MAEHRVGALLVVQGAELRRRGVRARLARNRILLGRSSSDTAVRTVMSSPVITVSPDDSVSHCMQLMTDRHVRHLPAVEAGG